MPTSSDHNLALTVRCLIEGRGDQWQAFTLEFGLAAQAESEADVKRKLEDMLHTYLYDALVGEDRAHAAQLLQRRATWQVFARYYLAMLRNKIRDGGEGIRHSTYVEPIPLQPARCAA